MNSGSYYINQWVHFRPKYGACSTGVKDLLLNDLRWPRVASGMRSWGGGSSCLWNNSLMKIWSIIWWSKNVLKMTENDRFHMDVGSWMLESRVCLCYKNDPCLLKGSVLKGFESVSRRRLGQKAMPLHAELDQIDKELHAAGQFSGNLFEFIRIFILIVESHESYGIIVFFPIIQANYWQTKNLQIKWKKTK